MNEYIDIDCPISQAYWCGSFCCSNEELAATIRIMDSIAVNLVGL